MYKNHLMCLDLVHSNRTIPYFKKYFNTDIRISASKASDPENLKNVSHPRLMFHCSIKAKSVMEGYGREKHVDGFEKGQRRQAPSQHACFICNNVSLLTKYLSAEAVNVCVCVSEKFIPVNISSHNLCLNVS